MKLVVLATALALVLAIAVFRAVSGWCRLAPGRRPWFILAGLAALGLVGALAPGMFRLEPPWSESPSGLFLIGARLLGLGSLGVASLATVVAAATATRPADPD
jgi:hypothetical protein